MNKIKIRKLCLFLLSLYLFFSSLSYGQEPAKVTFVNTGKMYVSTGGDGVELYIPDGVLFAGGSSVVQNGITAIGGNFYQNASTNVFALDNNHNFTVSTGTVRFITTNTPITQREIAIWPSGRVSIPNRYTASNPGAGDFFERGKNYIAFPNIEIATNDTIHVGVVMGIDAININRTSTSGALYLESSPVGTDRIFDASLRVTGNSVTAGAVVIEKYIWPFRNKNDGNHYLYPFASPYTNQRAGYYAGNWVRAPQADVNGSYSYPYGNKKSASGNFIDASQFVHGADDLLSAGAPYLIELQPQGFDYDLPFVMTGGNDHDLPKFIFNGRPYDLPYVAEQKFTGNIFNRNAKAGTAVGNKTQNWVIGNSYTSALSIDSLVEAIKNSNIAFSKVFYVYPHGGTSYVTCNIDDVANLPDIPAMSVFMLIVSSSNSETAEAFTITPNMQVHNKSVKSDGSGALKSFTANRSAAHHVSTLTFRLTPEDNPYIYDQTRIVLQAGASEGSDSGDVSKLLHNGHFFNLYGQAGSSKLQTNSLPENTTETSLCVTAPKFPVSCRLTCSGIETLTTEILLLHDKKLNIWSDLLKTPGYVFMSEPNDNSDRFTVYFKSPTGINNIITETMYAYYQDNTLYLNRLIPEDNGSKLSIYNASGVLLQQAVIDRYPQYQATIDLPKGMYIARIEGSRNTVLKFIKRID